MWDNCKLKMENSVDFLDDINNKYADMEHELEQKLHKMWVIHQIYEQHELIQYDCRKLDEKHWENIYGQFDKPIIKSNDFLSANVDTLEVATNRNSQIIKVNTNSFQ